MTLFIYFARVFLLRAWLIAIVSVVKVLIDVAFALVYFTSLVKGGWLTTADPLSPPSVDSIKVRLSYTPRYYSNVRVELRDEYNSYNQSCALFFSRT